VEALNASIAGRLEEVAALVEAQGANPFRVRAYRRAAATVRRLPEPIDGVLERGGLRALEELPGIGPGLARSIHALVTTGRLPMLERLRGAVDPVELLQEVPGIGRRTADRLHHDLGIDTLEELESAAHDGRLEDVPGLGPKRLAGIRESLAQRLGRVRRESPSGPSATVAELLDVDAEYRRRATARELPEITPRRFNPDGRARLPVLHTQRGPRHYTALFSNTARAHRYGGTRDWVVLYADGGEGESTSTVITARFGSLAGRRIVRGRESECAIHYAAAEEPRSRSRLSRPAGDAHGPTTTT